MNTIKLKQGCKSELGIKLHQHFLGKISGVVGRDFEDLICDYFDGNYTQTNIQDRVESAFCDVRKDDTYISVKYSQAVKDKTLSTVTGDNFRTTTIAKMISQSVLMSEGKYTYELGQLNSREELEEFINNLTQSQFNKLQTFFETMPRVRHNIKYQNPKTGKEFEMNLTGTSDFF